MVLGRYLSRPQWEKILKAAGAEPAPYLGKLGSAEWWRLPGKFPFTVPVEDGGKAEFWAIQKLSEALGAPSIFNSPLIRDDDED